MTIYIIQILGVFITLMLALCLFLSALYVHSEIEKRFSAKAEVFSAFMFPAFFLFIPIFSIFYIFPIFGLNM
jgi:hypothetical protein